MSTELYIPPTPRPKPTRCPKTGRFLPGHVPANKGKTWGDYMTKRAQRRAAKGWKNCEIGHAYGRKRPDNSGRCRKPVVAITDDGTLHAFSFIGAAALWCGGSRENVGRCCRDNHAQRVNKHDWSKGRKKGSGHINTDHRYMGIRFYFEADHEIWMPKFKKQ